MVTARKGKKSGPKRRVARGAPEYALDAELVPFPEKKRIGAKKIYFPFDVMEVGRSFTTPRAPHTLRKAIRRFRVEQGHPEMEFLMEEKDGRVRCWRKT